MEKDQIETTPELELSKIRIRKMSNEVESLQHKLRDCQDELDSHLKLVIINYCTSFSWLSPKQHNKSALPAGFSHFQPVFKITRVTPLFKKVSKTNQASKKPVSTFAVTLKIAERIKAKQMAVSLVWKFTSFSSIQIFLEIIHTKLKNSEVAQTGLLDCSKVFDMIMINHEI